MNRLLLHESIQMKCPEKANLYRQKADQWLPGTGVGEGIEGKQVEWITLGGENILKFYLEMFSQLCKLTTYQLIIPLT